MYDLLVRLAAVVDLGSVTAAANVLNVTQPAVTKSLRQLEEHYQATLLIRTKKGMIPTDYGMLVYRFAKLAQKAMEDLDAEISARRSADNRHLIVGAGLLWCYRYLPDVLARLRTRTGGLDATVIVKPPEELHEMVCNGDLDVGIAQMPAKRVAGLVYEELLVSKSMLFCHRNHPLRREGKITHDRLGSYPWITFTADENVASAHTSRLDRRPEIKINNLMLACMIMKDEEFLMLLPELLAPVIERFEIDPLNSDEGSVEFTSGLFYRESALLRTSSRALIDDVRSFDSR